MSPKKIWRFISSMRFAIILLVVLAAVCALGSFITQGQSFEWYSQAYNQRVAALIIALGLDDVFHSLWFIVLTAFLCLNLLLCNILRFPAIRKRSLRDRRIDFALTGPVTATVDGVDKPEEIFAALKMPKPIAMGTPDYRPAMYSVKNRIGIWGAWVTHLGILLLILGFGLGQATHQEWTVYGVAGQTKNIEGANVAVTINDFEIGLREDDTVEQYTTELTVNSIDPQGRIRTLTGEVSVNHPGKFFGLRFYQNSTGWAADIEVLKNGEPLQFETVCAGEYIRISDKQDLVVYFNAFYPDYIKIQNSMPATASSQLNNPAYLYSVYYQDEIIGMNVLTGDETITIDDYEVIFKNPRNYTLLQIKRDRFQILALLGGIVTVLGLALSFYVQTRKVWAVQDDAGLWTVSGYSQKGGVIFRERFNEAAAKFKITEGPDNGSD